MSRRPPLQSFHLGYADNSKTSALAAPSGRQIKLFSCNVQNRGGSAIDVGIAIKLAPQSWQIGQLIVASTPDFTDATTAIQAGTATNIFTTTNNDGFLVQADRPFNVIGLTVSQAQSGSPVFAYSYYNGSAYTTLSTIAVPASYTAADQVISFQAPMDWAAGTTAAVGGSSSLYSVRVIASTASGQAVKVTAAWVAKFLAFQEAIADNANLEVSFTELNPFLLESGEGILPYFGGTANAQNQVSGFYALSD